MAIILILDLQGLPFLVPFERNQLFRRVRDSEIPQGIFQVPEGANLSGYLGILRKAIAWINQYKPDLGSEDRIKLILEGFANNPKINLKEAIYNTLELRFEERDLFFSVITAEPFFPQEVPQDLAPIEEDMEEVMGGWIILYDEDGNLIKKVSKESGLSRKDYEALKNGYIRTKLSGTGSLNLAKEVITCFRDYPDKPIQIHKANGLITWIWIFDENSNLLSDKEFLLVYVENELKETMLVMAEEDLEKLEASYSRFKIVKRMSESGNLVFAEKVWAGTQPIYMLTESYFEDKKIDKIVIYNDKREIYEKKQFIYYKDISVPIAVDIYDAQGNLTYSWGYIFIFENDKLRQIKDRLSKEEMQVLDEVRLIKRTDQDGELIIGNRSWWQGLPARSITESDIIQGKLTLTKVYDESGNLMADKTREMILVFNLDKTVLDEVYPRMSEEDVSGYKEKIIRTRLTKDARLNIFGRSPLYNYPEKYKDCVIDLYIEDGQEAFMRKSWIYDLPELGDILKEGRLLEEREFIIEDGKVIAVYVKEYIYDEQGNLREIQERQI